MRPDEIESGRSAFAARRWADAYSSLKAADARTGLAADDLERLAEAAYLVGEDAEAIAAWTRAHHLHADAGRNPRAAQLACRISLISLLSGDMAHGTGWLSRARRLLVEGAEGGAEQGFVVAIEALLALAGGEPAAPKFAEATAAASQSGNADLLALSLLGQGQALVGEQRFAEGRALLDEAMIGISTGDVSPVLAGIVYCAVILTCQAMFDLERAREWTAALDAWCSAQVGMRPFRGQCLVHRSEILQLRGDLTAALEEAAGASEHLAGRTERVVGHAFYQRAEINRLRGDLDEARRLYAAAGANGFEPQPGAALNLLALGQVKEAAAAIRGALDMAGAPHGLGNRHSRPRMLGAFVDIHLAAGDVEPAAEAAEELSRHAAAMDSALLSAESRQAAGAVLLARGEAFAAFGPLREAWTAWQRLGMPYQSARVRVLMGRACEAQGNAEAARPHFEAAREVFARLGAAPDEALAAACLAVGRKGDLGLTRRESEVLALVTTGAANREIADRLGISEHTVARHMSNIFDKLGVNSRTAASAMAHERRLV